jgi:uncharacterized protein with ParB-like and HNH nuclease domain
VQAYTYELKQIMTPERRYVIPTFQRDYEWTKDQCRSVTRRAAAVA